MQRKETHAYFETSRSTPAMVTQAALVLAAVAAAPIVPIVLGITLEPPLFRGPTVVALTWSTALLAFVVAHFATRAATAVQAAWICVTRSIVLGALNCGLTLFIAELAQGDVLGGLMLGVVGSFAGLLYGAPAGFAFGLAFIAPTVMAVESRNVGSHAATERTLVGVGAWLMVVSGASLFVVGSSLSGLVAGIILVAGTVAQLYGGARMLRRHLWLREIGRGESRDWAVAPRAEHPDAAKLQPFVHQPADLCTKVLIERREHTGPYRCGNDVAVALL